LARGNKPRAESVDQSVNRCLAELVHRVVRAAGLQGRLACKVFLVVIAKIRTGHVLVPHAGNTLADFLALDVKPDFPTKRQNIER
jgi:hypothetical protein